MCKNNNIIIIIQLIKEIYYLIYYSIIHVKHQVGIYYNLYLR